MFLRIQTRIQRHSGRRLCGLPVGLLLQLREYIVLCSCCVVTGNAAFLLLICARCSICCTQGCSGQCCAPYDLCGSPYLLRATVHTSAQYCSHDRRYGYPWDSTNRHRLRGLFNHRWHLMCLLVLIIHSRHFIPELGLKGCYELLPCHGGLFCHITPIPTRRMS